MKTVPPPVFTALIPMISSSIPSPTTRNLKEPGAGKRLASSNPDPIKLAIGMDPVTPGANAAPKVACNNGLAPSLGKGRDAVDGVLVVDPFWFGFPEKVKAVKPELFRRNTPAIGTAYT